jgi:hypothetical protein
MINLKIKFVIDVPIHCTLYSTTIIVHTGPSLFGREELKKPCCSLYIHTF